MLAEYSGDFHCRQGNFLQISSQILFTVSFYFQSRLCHFDTNLHSSFVQNNVHRNVKSMLLVWVWEQQFSKLGWGNDCPYWVLSWLLSVPGTKFALRPLNPLTPNDHYRGRTAPLISKRCTLYIYSTNIVTEYFKHATYSPFFLFKINFVS